MKLLFPTLVFLLALHAPARADSTAPPDSTGAGQVWSEFVALVRTGAFPSERIRPYHESLLVPLGGFLKIMNEKADWQEWRNPETVWVGRQLHFILPLTFDGSNATYCFSFITDNNTWYFQHLETITIRMDQLGALPTSRFPDLPESTKAGMRAEFEVSRDVALYNMLLADKGGSAALDWFKDGNGYALAARAWVPFAPPARAFILYLCWEQANLRGNGVTLVQVDDDSAQVRLRPRALEVYQVATHLKQQIQPEAFQRLFETPWQDRAAAAGWDLKIDYNLPECVFHFTKRAMN